MDWGTIVFGSLLVVMALVLLGIHWQSWQKIDHGGLSERERLFYRQQFRRRIQASGMLGVVGLLMIGTLWLETAWSELLAWLGIMLALLWTIGMALLDWWSTRTYFGRDEAITAAQIGMLKREIRKYAEEQRREQEE